MNCRTKYGLKYRVPGLIGLLIFVPPLFTQSTENPTLARAVFGLFALLSIYCIIEGISTLKITPEMIIAQKLYGCYGIRWDEIETIRYGYAGDWLTFESMLLEGNNKRLAIPGPNEWAGRSGAQLRQWFHTEVRRRGLEIKASTSAPFKCSKNARLS